MTRTVGIDVGSTYTKGLLLADGERVLGHTQARTGFRLEAVARQVFDEVLKSTETREEEIAYIVSTGFGRHQVGFRDAHVTDLTATARGAALLFPETRTVLDIGGQTMKASRCDAEAKVRSFRLNDKCAAGTGAFLEKTAHYMGYDIEEIGPLVATSKEPVPISGVCAVFAESEVINHLSQGRAPADILHGAIVSLVGRSVQLMKRVRMEPEYTLVGGILRFPTMVQEIQRQLGQRVNVPRGELVQFAAALGAAVLGHRRYLRLAEDRDTKDSGLTPEIAGGPRSSVEVRSSAAQGGAGQGETTPGPNCAACLLFSHDGNGAGVLRDEPSHGPPLSKLGTTAGQVVESHHRFPTDLCALRSGTGRQMFRDAESFTSKLGAVPALQGISTDGREALARIATLRAFAGGETILAQGGETSSFFVIVSGRAKLCRDLTSGRGVILALFGPNDLFGAVAALGAQTCDSAVVALDRMLCLEVKREDLFRLFGEYPGLIPDVLPVLTRQLVECKNCIVELSCYRVETRFAQIFLDLAERIGQPADEGVLLPLHLSRQELADLAGTTIETAIRTLSRWGKEGTVETLDDGFLIPDPAALQKLAQV